MKDKSYKQYYIGPLEELLLLFDNIEDKSYCGQEDQEQGYFV
jgi:hypothetical protein